jgi:predicted PurR-regulated permease PerM
MFLLVLVVIVALILPVIGSVTASVLDNVSSTKDQLKRTIIDPIGSLKSSPSKLKNVFQNSAKILKSSSTSLKNNLNKRIH